ncbi:MAG: hypothetical protein ABTQ27_15565 [Amaricoccus sp.]|uniref:hypothetical protein n=1 Tax=Amaricoccus sp. TaxID=1872485 RepID=UPI00331554C5
MSILAYVRMLGRRLVPALEADLPALLGRRTPSGLRRVADAARLGRLHAGFPRDMLPIIADACAMAIEDGAQVAGEWVEVGWSDGGVDWAWRETTVYTDEARSLMRLRAMVGEIIDLLDRSDDLVAAQRDIGEVLD